MPFNNLHKSSALVISKSVQQSKWVALGMANMGRGYYFVLTLLPTVVRLNLIIVTNVNDNCLSGINKVYRIQLPLLK